MIDLICNCAVPGQASESTVGKHRCCPNCGLVIQPVSGETIPEGNGLGDFDSGLVVTVGPETVGTRILLGGIAEILIGKLPERHIALPGKLVSRLHCKLSRVDIGPSRWKIIDNHSTNGLFVNGQRVAEHELEEGDVIAIGEYRLEFRHFELPSPGRRRFRIVRFGFRGCGSGFGIQSSGGRVESDERADLSQLRKGGAEPVQKSALVAESTSPLDGRC